MKNVRILSIVILAVSVLAGSFMDLLYTKFVTNSADTELQALFQSEEVREIPSGSQRLQNRSLLRASAPGPSPLLLFSMGFLGIVCVLINERRKRFLKQKICVSLQSELSRPLQRSRQQTSEGL